MPRSRFLLALFLAVLTTPAAAVRVKPGIGLIAVTEVSPGTEVVLRDVRGREVGGGTADRFGSFLFRDLTQGADYTVQSSESSNPIGVTVLRFVDHPDESF